MSLRSATNYVMSTLRQILPLKEFEMYVFIVGAQKAGTSALHSYLEMHPYICTGYTKELHFFDRQKTFEKGYAFYRALFPAFTQAIYALDSTPSYLYMPYVASRIYKFRPNSKIIIILRDPISRALSAFNMYEQLRGNRDYLRQLNSFLDKDSKEFFLPFVEGKVKSDIRYFLDRELSIMNGSAVGDEPALIRRGLYAPQIRRFVELFGRDNILILFSDELKEQTKLSVDRVLDFIGLPSLVHTKYERKHVREYTIDESSKKWVSQYAGDLFEQDKNELSKCFGLVAPW